jgi:hypothetical protein
VIIVEFASTEALKGWHASPEYAQAFDFRAGVLRRGLMFAAGVDQQPAPPGTRRALCRRPDDLTISFMWIARSVRQDG